VSLSCHHSVRAKTLYAQKSPIYPKKSPIYCLFTDASCHIRVTTACVRRLCMRKRALCIHKRAYFMSLIRMRRVISVSPESAWADCVCAKEPYISEKEPYFMSLVRMRLVLRMHSLVYRYIHKYIYMHAEVCVGSERLGTSHTHTHTHTHTHANTHTQCAWLQ